MNARLEIVGHDVAELKLAVRAIERRLDFVLPTLATMADLEELSADFEKLRTESKGKILK